MKNKLLFNSLNLKSRLIFLVVVLNFGLINSQTDIAVNGGFESGDFSGWTQFISGTQTVVSGDASEGTFYVELNNNVLASASLIKNANLGEGVATGGQEVTVSFDARGITEAGGVAFAELFSEISGGGVSKSEILSGGPLALDPDPTIWKSFSFTTTLGPIVSGGVTLQFNAATGGAAGSLSNISFDNVRVLLIDQEPSARVQVIHNSADAVASEVDVYLDGVLALDNFAFRTASPFIDVPAGIEISVAVAPSNSTSVADAIATFPYTLTEGETYVLVASGIVSPTGYSPATPFDIAVYALGQESAGTTGNTDVLVYHGVTDAPTVDVNEVTGPSVLVNDISYGEFDGYLELPTADYSINVSTADGSTVVESYDAPLATLDLDDAAIVVVASGFLDPSVNSNGPAFGLWVALPSGGALVELPIAGTTITDPSTDAPESGSTGTDLLVYSDLTGPRVTNFNFNAFSGPGGQVTISQVDIEGDGNNAGFITNSSGFFFYGAQWDAVDLTAGGYQFVHINYYATTATEFKLFLIDESAGIPGGNPSEPRFTFGGGSPDAPLVAGSWQSVFIPLQHFLDYDSTGFDYDLNDIFQWKFEGNGNIYFDNIFFSTTNTLSTVGFAKDAFTVSPNPTNSLWNVKTVNQTITNITVFDILGKQVIKMSPNSAEAVIDASNLKDGLYLAKISTENGSQTVKLIKN